MDYASFSATDGDYAVAYGVDAFAPTVLSVSPANGSVDVGLASTVSAIFSESMDAASINSSTFQLHDALGSPVSAAVSYTSETRTAKLTPTNPLDPDSTYTARIPAGGAADLFGNTIAADVVWTFTTEPPLNCPCSIWTDADTPAIASAADPNAVELGVKFRSDFDGFITGIRFYKGSNNAGTHVGNLWAADGTRLATATFTNETATGWQKVDFDTPVPISGNTLYVASYHAPNGGYAINASYFTASGVGNPPLHLYSDAEGGGNGVYRYGAGGLFPNQSWNASNYWVDVVFTDSGVIPGDTTQPTVTSTTPAGGATDIAVGSAVTAVFSEAMDAATISTATFALRDASNTLVPAAVTYNATTRTATLTPNSAMAASTDRKSVV